MILIWSQFRSFYRIYFIYTYHNNNNSNNDNNNNNNDNNNNNSNNNDNKRDAVIFEWPNIFFWKILALTGYASISLVLRKIGVLKYIYSWSIN